ncbi:hypothetical protein [Levilactobacillus yiduensis]|uniref:hypothetical protein n=1 Tax=Levilactobacillus yiduensis TaxID=2953880 RepID=UPI000EF298CD|nr:hypothetical protein [Levilactobacillus yiduensis]AYM02676.1 hypothetical protein D8911_06565 [Levilactobacillus brevis]
MHKLGKGFLLVFVALGMLVLATGTTADASAWHQGLPKLVRQHKLWASKKGAKFGSAKQLYSRNYIEIGKLTQGKWKNKYYFADVLRSYYKNGKYEDTFDEVLINNSRYESDPVPAYQKMGKHTYQIKSTLKRSGYSDRRYKVKFSNKNKKMTVWQKLLWNHIDPNKGLNRSQKKWHKLGEYHGIKTVSDDSLWKRDPVRK